MYVAVEEKDMGDVGFLQWVAMMIGTFFMWTFFKIIADPNPERLGFESYDKMIAELYQHHIHTNWELIIYLWERQSTGLFWFNVGAVIFIGTFGLLTATASNRTYIT